MATMKPIRVLRKLQRKKRKANEIKKKLQENSKPKYFCQMNVLKQSSQNRRDSIKSKTTKFVNSKANANNNHIVGGINNNKSCQQKNITRKSTDDATTGAAYTDINAVTSSDKVMPVHQQHIKSIKNVNSNTGKKNCNKYFADIGETLNDECTTALSTKANVTINAEKMNFKSETYVQKSTFDVNINERIALTTISTPSSSTLSASSSLSLSLVAAPSPSSEARIMPQTLVDDYHGRHRINNYEIHQLSHGQELSTTPQSTPYCSQQLTSASSSPKATTIYGDTETENTTITASIAATIKRRCELASPRCHSRESNGSGAAGDVRCPSNDSHCSANDNVTPAATPVPTTPPVGLPLQATLAPAAAAALLPPQSAAMAAYLNAAAAAAQQNHLLLTNPLAAAASFVQQATQAHSPIEGNKSSPTASDSPSHLDAPALDFSTKHTRRMSEAGSVEDDDESDEMKKRREVADNADGDDNAADDTNAPLDLSISTSRKRLSEDNEVPLRKTPRPSDYKPLAPGTWVPPINPYLAAVAAASLSPKAAAAVSLDCWSNKQKYAPNEATKALEKMTEMTRLGSGTSTENVRSGTQATNSSTASTTGSSNGRHSAWQSHWLTKGADAVKDVFKCVWCKQSFPTLASLTVHMKETQHCGVNVPAAVAAGSVNASANANASASAGSTTISTTSHHASRHSNTQSSNGGSSGGSNASSSSAAGSVSTATSSSKSDLNLLIKETMPLPRKLVRGQDVWLGKGAEQTRQILKCMWCGQSFRSLAEMTSHMQETQHYTNIISQEQIISWKSSDEKSSGTGSTSTSSSGGAAHASAAAVASAAVNTAVSAVLTCKVCDQAFPTLKELSNHMVKNAHYKEHMMRSATGGLECNAPNNTSPNSNTSRRGGRQLRGEKRKKSLPVRKLLELERAQHDYKIGNSSLDSALKPLRDFAASTKITCEKCGDKIETALFVDHIRQCLGGHIPMSPRHNNNNNNNNNLKSSYAEQQHQQQSKPQTPQSNQSDGRKTADMELTSPLTASTRSEILCPLPKEGEKSSSSAPSVLNAIEQLIEKSFDTRMRGNNSSYGSGGAGSKPSTPLGSSILKRLGIDDSVDYTKPLMDAQTMHFLRSYSSYSAPRDRSASESSSVSERCSSRLESSITPERSQQATPRLMTPEKPHAVNATPDLDERKIKAEPNMDGDEHEFSETRTDTSAAHHVRKISVKKEFNMTDADEGKPEHEDEVTSAVSPSLSERSLTPKSTCSPAKTPLPAAVGNSLNALSSMFDSLNSMTTNGGSISNSETNNNHAVGGKKSSANPLAALQKLCDTTTDPPAANTRSSAPAMSASAVAGNMVAFSWACNDGMMASPPDGMIKCSYCDLPFSSKGAYRHHLSKVHFIKDDSVERNSLKSPGIASSPKSIPALSPKRCSSKSPIAQRQSVSPAASISSVMTPTINPYDESPQSKFLKYTELAKQLSSKNV